MNEAQRLSVECLTGAEREAVLDELLVAGELVTPKDLVATIACISEERVPDVAHVGTDLVRASRLESAFDPADVGQLFEERVVGDGVLTLGRALGIDCHLQAVTLVTADVADDRAFGFLQSSPDEGAVGAAGRLVEELTSQMHLRFGTLGDDEQAARVLVDAMDETDVGVGGIIEGIILQVVRECIDQRASIVAVPWMDDEPRRLVDDHQHLIFVDDIQRNGLGDDLKLVLGTA